MSTEQDVVDLYCCMACPKTYTCKFNLRRHVEVVHFGIKHFECPTCTRKFTSKQNLKDHLNYHTGSTPFTCPVCGDSFKRGSQLSLHKRTHLKAEEDEISTQK